MKKELLYKYFSGHTSREEEGIIEGWVDASDANLEFFMQERQQYDVLLFAESETTTTTTTTTKNRIVKFSIWNWSIAASLILISMISILYFQLRRTSATGEFNVVNVPVGQRVEVQLSDSTKVWLSSNSSLKYPSNFDENERIIYLDGEGYFEVSSVKKQPFIVKNNLADIRVTGTKFNVKAIENKAHFEAILVEGGIDIYKNNKKLKSLIPNQGVKLIKNEFVLFNEINLDVQSWREGVIVFKNEEVENVLQVFEDKFGVNIAINPNKKFTHKYTGKFRFSDGIDYSLLILQKNIPFNYNRDYPSNTINIF